MSKKSLIEKELFAKKKQQLQHKATLSKVAELPVVVFDDRINYCASLVSTVTGQKIKIFDVNKNKLEFEIPSPSKSNIRMIKWCSIEGKKHLKSQQLVLCCDSGSILIYSLSDSEVILKLTEAHNGPVTDFVTFNKVGFSSSLDGKIARWDLTTGQLLNSWKAHKESIHKLSIFEDLPFLISGGNHINVWNIDTCDKVKNLPGHINKVQSISANSKHKVFLSVAHQDRFISAFNYVKTSNWDTFTPISTGLTLDEEIHQITLSNTSAIISVTGKGNVAIWRSYLSNDNKKGGKLADKRYPSTIIHFVNPSKVQIPVLQIACSDNNKSFTVARGDPWNLCFETLNIFKSYKDKVTTYECADPNAALKQNSTLNALSKISSQITVKSGLSTGNNASVALTMGQKLQLLQSELKINEPKVEVPNDKIKVNGDAPTMSESVAKVVQQALHTKDISLLDDTLLSTPLRAIPPTVAHINDTVIPKLFEYIVEQIRTKKGETLKNLEWIREILIMYSSYLVTIPWVADKLGQLIEVAESRGKHFADLQLLSSRLEHIENEMNNNFKNQSKRKVADIYMENDDTPINKQIKVNGKKVQEEDVDDEVNGFDDDDDILDELDDLV